MHFYTKSLIWSTIYSLVIVAIILLMRSTFLNPALNADQSESQFINEVSDSELLSFFRVNSRILELKDIAKQKMYQLIGDNGLSKERYNQIASMENDPQIKSDATQAEIEKARTISNGIEDLQTEMQQKAMNAIEKEDLSVERFQEISMELENNKQLQLRLQELLTRNES